ncbi:MAG: glycosyltransferase [Planctomycetes bacterium]|nr:glycosyltransferase [Planctomycetota bacterium]
MSLPEVVLLHEWLIKYAGSEKALDEIISEFGADTVYTLVRSKECKLKNRIRIRASFLNKLPFSDKLYKHLLPLHPLAVDSISVPADNKIILSSSHALIKGIKKRRDQMHICYCHTPPRYLYDLRGQYFTGLKLALLSPILDCIMAWDQRRVKNIDYFVANSGYIRDRIKRVYDRDSKVIYPPCRIDFGANGKKEDFFVTISRLVPYKKVDLIVRAFNELKLPLIVIGDGSQLGMIKSIANGNVKILGWVDGTQLADLMKKARGFVFAAEEDFGIVCVEAQACGTPVICYSKGGQTESVINWNDSQEKATGILFNEQSKDGVIEGVQKFLEIERDLKPDNFQLNVQRFSSERFRKEIRQYVTECWSNFSSALH